VNLVAERIEIPLYIQELKSLKFKDKLTGFSAIIKFWGADHSRNLVPPSPQRWQTSIKIEIILYEEMVFSPILKSVYHDYSDNLTEVTNRIPCYSLNEVLAEKLRSLIQRSYTAPRDFYDIWYLSQYASDLNWPEIVRGFHQKMKFKGFEFTGIDQMINAKNDQRLEAAWKNSLGHQIAKERLPEYKKVKEFLFNLFNVIMR